MVYAVDVERTARFWERLGFARFYRFPAEGEAGSWACGAIAPSGPVVAEQWPRNQYGLEPGTGPRFEMFVYVPDVDELVPQLRAAGVTVLREPADMPWGERIASVADPDGNPVALANEPGAATPGAA